MHFSILLSLVLSVTGVLSTSYYPKEFDISLIPQSKNCNFLVLSEGLCIGGNWASAFAHALHLSKCVRTFDYYPNISSEELIRCADVGDMDRCSSSVNDLSIVEKIGDYLKNQGLSSSNCLPYNQGNKVHLKNPECPKKCQDGSQKQSIIRAEIKELQTKEDVMNHIGQYGPVVVAIRYKSSFNKYLNGEYSVTQEQKEDELDFGFRFLLILGWKTNQQGQKVWKVQNTFGQQWANQGNMGLPVTNPYIDKYYSLELVE